MSFDQTKRLHDVTAVAINTTRPSQCWRDWTGTEVAIESTGATLIKGDLSGSVKAIQVSRGTMSNVCHNQFFAFVYNALGIPIAAGLLVPFFGNSALLSRQRNEFQQRLGHRQFLATSYCVAARSLLNRFWWLLAVLSFVELCVLISELWVALEAVSYTHLTLPTKA